MTICKMHADEVETSPLLVQRLLTTQFPQWANLPINPVPSMGTDHALYRIGETLVARLPRIHWALGQAEKEHTWLPRLAPHLPFAVPVPLAKGTPGEGYPYPWSLYEWLDGENPTGESVTDLPLFAADVARFIAALQRVDTTGGPVAGPHNFGRGVPLAERDAPTRAAIDALRGVINVDAATAVWELALQTPTHDGPPVWVHGDLQAGNLLVRKGSLYAVIDFGGLAVGDPACDLIFAWNFLSASARKTFRAVLSVDDTTWERGRGWALSVALIALPYYQNTNPALAAASRHTISEVLHGDEKGEFAGDRTNV